MSKLDDLTTEELRRELERREPQMCPTCRKWTVTVTAYATRTPSPHCAGCMRPVAQCRCSR